MSDQSYDADVFVVGGGIHGVGVAQAASSLGYSVILVDRDNIASGTSSKSSKLIHGGLRYLESFQFSLVKSCLEERALLLQNAPDLVKQVPFFIPVYKFTRRRPWKIGLGLLLYNLLSGLRSPYRRLSASEWRSLDSLTQDNLQSVFQYYDAQTDDVLLTRAVAKSSTSMGARILVETELVSCELRDNGCEIQVKSKNLTHRYWCRVMINAAGHAVNDVLECCRPQPAKMEIELVQGTHIVLDVPAKQGVYYLESPLDGRAVFAMPWKGKTLVGTTETVVDSGERYPEPLPGEIKYLLDVYSGYFPEDKVQTKNVTESFAGFRVLLKNSESIFSRNRDTVLLVNSETNPRVLSIYGGKLTAYRATAEKVLRKIICNLPEPDASGENTRNLKLTN